ncbi:hypothetical protein PMIN03_010452 [Paraphaeosphaeria minitans]
MDPEDSPERPGDMGRPSFYITDASLCKQTARELARTIRKLKVIYVGGDAIGSNMTYRVVDPLPGVTESVWNFNDARNIRKVFVMSYNHLARYYGPQAYWSGPLTSLSMTQRVTRAVKRFLEGSLCLCNNPCGQTTSRP